MPPRYAYWTILIGDAPTAFRAGAQEELLPTLKRLQAKHPEAKMMWWQNGKLWPSRLDAQEAMRARGDMGRKGDFRQRESGGFRDRNSPPRPTEPRQERDPSGKLGWKPKGEFTPAPPAKPEWKPKGEFTPERPAKPDWKPKGSFKADRPVRSEWKSRDNGPRRSEKPEWKPKGAFKADRPARPDWKSKPRDDRPRRSEKPEWRPKDSGSSRAPRPRTQDPRRERAERSARPEWKPKASGPQDLKTSGPPKRKWVPKEEYKKSQGIEAKRDAKWRPGGQHKDPKQKYKDAKKAKWGKFKQTIRKRWESKPGSRKKKDEE